MTGFRRLLSGMATAMTPKDLFDLTEAQIWRLFGDGGSDKPPPEKPEQPPDNPTEEEYVLYQLGFFLKNMGESPPPALVENWRLAWKLNYGAEQPDEH